jgi:hypothetical protein
MDKVHIVETMLSLSIRDLIDKRNEAVDISIRTDLSSLSSKLHQTRLFQRKNES